MNIGTVKLVGNLTVTVAANHGWSQVNGVIDLNGYTLSTNRFYKSALNEAVYGSDIGPYGVYFGSTNLTVTSTVVSTVLLNFPDLTAAGGAIVTSTGGGFTIAGTGTTQTVTWTGNDVNNAANFTWAKATDRASITDGLNCNNWVVTGNAGCLSQGVTVYVYGNITWNATSTFTGLRMYYTGSGTCTWTNPSGITIGAFWANGNVSLSGAMTLLNTQGNFFGTLTLESGTFTTNNNALSIGRFYGSYISGPRAMALGTTSPALTATQNNAVIFDMSDASQFTFTGTGSFTRSVSTATGQSIITTYNSIETAYHASFNFITGNAAISFNSGGVCKNLTFQTAYTGVVTGGQDIAGDLTLSSAATYTGMQFGFVATAGITQTVNWANKTVSSIAVSCFPTAVVSFTGSVTCTGAFTYYIGGLTLAASSTFTCGSIVDSSSGSARSLTFGSGSKFSVTGSGANILTQSATGLTVVGTYYVLLTYTGSAGVRTITLSDYTASALAPTISTTGTSGIVVTSSATDTLRVEGTAGDIDLATTNIFSGTFDVGTGLTVYGNFKIGSPTATQSNTTILTFGATSSKTITSGGVTFNFPITINGVGGTWTCQDALTLASTRALTMTNGTLALKNGVTSTVGSFVTTGTTLKYLKSSTDASSATLSDASGTNTVTYLSIKDSAATGGATFNATDPTNVDAGNNSGWLFAGGVTATGNMFIIFN